MEMEAKDHNRLLNGVDDDFDSTTRFDLFSKTLLTFDGSFFNL